MNRHLRLPVRPAQILAAGGIAVLLTVLFFAPLSWMAQSWRDNEYYAHGSMIPLVCIWLAWRQRDSLRHPAEKPVLAGMGVVALAVLLRVLAADNNLAGAMAFLLALAGLVWTFWGTQTLRRLAFPLAFFGFAVPLPLLDDLGFYFQRATTVVTAWLLVHVGVPATYQGAEVSLPGGSFIVGTPCSGLYSLVALTSLGVLYAAVLSQGSLTRRMFFVALLVPIALTCNIFRLGSLMTIAYRFGNDLAMRFYHDFSDVLFWLIALALMLLLGSLLSKGVSWPASAVPSH